MLHGNVDIFSYKDILKAQSCKLNNNKYMITLIQITNIEIFVFIAVLVFKLLSREVVKFYLQTEKEISQVYYCQIINSWNVKFSGYI